MTKSSNFIIERLIDIRKLEESKFELRIKWKGYSKHKNSWEFVSDIDKNGLEGLLYNLLERKKSKARLIQELLEQLEKQDNDTRPQMIEEISITSCLENDNKSQDTYELNDVNKSPAKSYKSSITSKSSLREEESEFTESIEPINSVFSKSEDKSRFYIDTDSYTFRNMLNDIYNPISSTSAHVPYSYCRLRDVLISPAIRKPKSDFNIDFMNVKMDTEVQGIGILQGLQKLYGPMRCFINFRVKVTNNDISDLKTIDSVFLNCPKAAYTHLKKKLCQLFLIKLAYTQYMANVTQLVSIK